MKKVKLNEAMAGVNESYSVGDIIEVPKDLAERLVSQGTANYHLDTDEVLDLKEVISNLEKEVAKQKKANKNK